jgi:hypothetical protein
MRVFDDVRHVKWYAVPDDLIGGWAVSHVDKPLSEQDAKAGEGEIASFMDQQAAEYIANLHNTYLKVIAPTDTRKKALDDMVAQAEELGLPY